MLKRFNDVKVSLFAHARATKPDYASLADVLDDIRTCRYAEKINLLRTLYPCGSHPDKSASEEYRNKKKELPAFTASGIFSGRKATDLILHSGFICIDLDKLVGIVQRVRADLKKDPHIAWGFVSPSGEGLKIGVPIDGKKHLEEHRAVQEYFLSKYKLQIDPSCKDVSRLCFLSSDAALWVRQDARQIGAFSPPIRLHTTSCIPEPLHSCVSASLHNTCDAVLTNILSGRSAVQSLGSEEKRRLYMQLVEDRFQPKAAERNKAICEAVPFLYRAVAPPIIVELMACFYDCNKTYFKDKREQHIMEVEAMIKSTAESYRAELDERQLKIYEAIQPNDRAAFRICRDLAMRPEPKRPPFTFFMSYGQLGTRIGIYAPQAQRIMRRFERYGLVKLLEKGTRRNAGERARGGSWKWLIG